MKRRIPPQRVSLLRLVTPACPIHESVLAWPEAAAAADGGVCGEGEHLLVSEARTHRRIGLRDGAVWIGACSRNSSESSDSVTRACRATLPHITANGRRILVKAHAMRSALFLLLAIAAPSADACIQPPFSCDRHVESAELLAIGIVRSEEPVRPGFDSVSDRSVLVEPVETPIGDHSGSLLVPVMCFSPLPTVGDRVVIGIDREGRA